MPRTNPKPISMAVEGIPFDSIPLQELRDKGHPMYELGSQEYLENEDEVDVIFGPKCHKIEPRMRLGNDSTDNESLRRQLEMMIAGRRAIKYPKEKHAETK